MYDIIVYSGTVLLDKYLSRKSVYPGYSSLLTFIDFASQVASETSEHLSRALSGAALLAHKQFFNITVLTHSWH